jgi:hypothetical protein
LSWSGISYDAANNSLWVSDQSLSNTIADTIADYTLGGVLISSFHTGNTFDQALAYDPADGTLWLNTFAVGGIDLQQWSTSGAHLHDLSFTGLPGATNVLGAEFEEPGAIPEPSSVALLTTVGGALLFSLRRKRVNAGPIT